MGSLSIIRQRAAEIEGKEKVIIESQGKDRRRGQNMNEQKKEMDSSTKW